MSKVHKKSGCSAHYCYIYSTFLQIGRFLRSLFVILHFAILKIVAKTFMRKKFIITLWVILFLCISAVSLAFYAIWHGWIGYMPNLYQLENPVHK